jgi:hypothetical protein
MIWYRWPKVCPGTRLVAPLPVVKGFTNGAAMVSASAVVPGRDGTGGVRSAVATLGRGRGVLQTTQLLADSGASFPQFGHLII